MGEATSIIDKLKRRTLSPVQLNDILEQHKKWLKTRAKEGKIADLEYVDLKGANLYKAYLVNANLQGANLQGANLQGANLEEANLKNAELREANLQGANLYKANLQGANLYKANLKEAELYIANLSSAELREADLREAKLIEANLYHAMLEEATLENADLQGANLDGAYLVNANLQKARLFEAILLNAYLQNADLTGVIGLMGGQIAGAGVAGAKLPKDILEFEGLKTVAEASKNARKLFFGMLLGCIYSWLTIATTTDARLLTNSASSPLPIIRTEIPIVGFFLIAPLILLSVYFYFHIYMQRLWEGLAKLPAVFPDGRALHERAYPWLLTGLVCAHFKLLKPKRPVLSRLQVFLSIILAWWIIPVTLFLFWARFLPRHDSGGTALHVIMVVISITAAIFLYRIAVSTLRGIERKPFLWKNAFKDSKTYIRSAVTLGIVAIGIGFYIFSIAAIYGVRPGYPTSYPRGKVWIPESNSLAPKLLMYPGIRTYADFFEAYVSERPPNLSETSINDELRLVKGARLKGRNLLYAYAVRAFLVNADLRRTILVGADLYLADLRGADLQDAVLWRADLQEANLQGVKNLSVGALKRARNWTLAYYDDDFLTKLELPSNHNERLKVKDFSGYNFAGHDLWGAGFREADLRGADLMGAILWVAGFWDADLRGADLRGAELMGARLYDASFWDADLRGADLQDAVLWGADLQEANLQGVKNLSVGELKRARNWTLAYYDDDFLTKLELPSNHNERLKVKDFSGYNFSGADLQYADLQYADLQYADLQGANLQGASLWEADLRGADLSGADLSGADLQGANLQGVKNSSVEQFSEVKTLFEAKLDPEMMEQVKDEYPHLLEKSKPEEKEKED